MSQESPQQQGAAQAAEQAGGSLIDQLIESTRVKPGDDAYSITRQGLEAFVAELLEPNRAKEKVSQGMIDEMIAGLDRKLCQQVDAIMHEESFQKMESSWRSLKFLVDRTDFRENNRIDRKSTRLNSSPLMRISYAVFCLKKKNKLT